MSWLDNEVEYEEKALFRTISYGRHILPIIEYDPYPIKSVFWKDPSTLPSSFTLTV